MIEHRLLVVNFGINTTHEQAEQISLPKTFAIRVVGLPEVSITEETGQTSFRSLHVHVIDYQVLREMFLPL
jgi:predicted subunit of tRNA(5-methylaminomethyl-2-thiouridylate) methyltransferase